MIVPKVYLRADGGPSIGMGHVIRSLALGNMLSERFECVLVTRFSGPYLEKEARKAKVSILTLSTEGDEHYQQFLDLLTGEEIVVLDNYFFETEFQKSIKMIGSRLVCIDDIYQSHFVADLVINHSPSAKASLYSKEKNTRLLLGLDYVLLRKKFIQLARESSVSQTDNPKRILLCFGGADINNITLKATRELLKAGLVEHIDILIGSSYSNKEELQKYADLAPVVIKIHEGIAEEEVISLIQQCHRAVIPCSSVLFEVIAAKRSFVSGYFVDNQEAINDHFVSLGYKNFVGDFNNNCILPQHFIEAVNFDFDNLIDGNSPQRLLSEFELLSNS